MSTETILTDEQIRAAIDEAGPDNYFGLSRAIEQAVLQTLEQRWIDCTYAMPEPYREVYAKHKDGSVRIARLSKSQGGCWQLATFLIDTKYPYVWSPDDVAAWKPIYALQSPEVQALSILSECGDEKTI